ncbi:hypothetical protein DPEC_G00160200 [Dallia pectoralis]|uniref:Uncharacterized protein n=1 Tax=Dallia pectoralis TaxID=75939 RepID=A0ACC2GFP4_DALPE|nr:hypothetical protein DPEC_G00160200 [Dallia pectoralis]
MQLALGVTSYNKEHHLPPRKSLWIHPSLLHPGNLPHGRASRGQGLGGHPPPSSIYGSGSISASSSVNVIHQAKPSLRRIKGRIHRSKSLDSIDLMDSNFSLDLDHTSWSGYDLRNAYSGCEYPTVEMDRGLDPLHVMSTRVGEHDGHALT